MATWNARALLHVTAGLRRRKLATLRGILAQCDILALLEVHLNVEALQIEMAPLLCEWILEMTSDEDMATGALRC